MFRRHFEFPQDSVLMKTISLPEDGSAKSPKRIETQLLHFDGYQWQGYTYRWNDQQTEASLVPAEGDEAAFTVKDERAPGGTRTLHWTFSSRSQCMTCHTPWAESTLAFTSGQLLTPLPGETTNRLDQFELSGLLARQESKQPPPKNQSRWDQESVLVPPFEEKFPLDERARSYIDANCSHCHRFGGGGAALIDLRAGIPIDKMKAVDEVPKKGDLELHDAKIIAPGNPWRSVLFLRMSTCGRGRMPHLASEVVDQRGLALIEEWIRSMKDGSETESKSLEAVVNAASVTPAAEARRGAIDSLLADRASALFLARALDGGKLKAQFAAETIAAVNASAVAAVRDLFAVHLPAPPADRVGQVPRPRLILNRTGDAARGKTLFLTSTTLNCKTCHKVGTEGGQVGPELTQIGGKRRREDLIDGLINPSAVVDPKFAQYIVQTTDGRVVTGVLADRNAKRVQLRDAKGELHEVPTGQIEEMKPQRTSIMPEGLMKDLTLQEAADLLAFLESLR
jgi:putative heme-binding domain-containing protein